MYLADETKRDQHKRLFNALFCHAVWNIGIVQQPIEVFLEPDAPLDVRWFPPLRRGKYLSDPFGIVRDGRGYVFCEEFDYAIDRGVISCIELSEDGLPASRRVVIEMPFHMSYPFLFEYQGLVYCIPETYQAREISLYMANDFPASWTKLATLIRNFAGIDSTVFYHEGRWWIACTDYDTGANSSLFLWYSTDFRGSWKPHSGNPVKRGGRNGTRPAGTPFVQHGRLYRPAMDSSILYGEKIVLNHVVKLTPTDFEERPVRVIEPFRTGRYADGIHTVSRFGGFTLVDGYRISCNRHEFRRALRRERLNIMRRFGLVSRES